MKIEEFRSLYCAFPSKIPVKPEHAKLIPEDQGLQIIPPIIGNFNIQYMSLFNADDAESDRYLWVFRECDQVIALERCAFAATIEGNKVKHTNLTGNTLGRCGGELWLSPGNVLIMNGSSGRYPTTSEEQLEHVGLVLKGIGFNVAIMKFLPDGMPRVIIERKEDLRWL